MATLWTLYSIYKEYWLVSWEGGAVESSQLVIEVSSHSQFQALNEQGEKIFLSLFPFFPSEV